MFSLHSWLYRIRPSVCHTPYEPFHKKTHLVGNYSDEANVNVMPNQLRWSPFDLPTEPTDFVEGLHSIAGAGDVGVKHGMAVLIYAANKNMDDAAFYNSDGDFLIGTDNMHNILLLSDPPKCCVTMIRHGEPRSNDFFVLDQSHP